MRTYVTFLRASSVSRPSQAQLAISVVTRWMSDQLIIHNYLFTLIKCNIYHVLSGGIHKLRRQDFTDFTNLDFRQNSTSILKSNDHVGYATKINFFLLPKVKDAKVFASTSQFPHFASTATKRLWKRSEGAVTVRQKLPCHLL